MLGIWKGEKEDESSLEGVGGFGDDKGGFCAWERGRKKTRAGQKGVGGGRIGHHQHGKGFNRIWNPGPAVGLSPVDN